MLVLPVPDELITLGEPYVALQIGEWDLFVVPKGSQLIESHPVLLGSTLHFSWITVEDAFGAIQSEQDGIAPNADSLVEVLNAAIDFGYAVIIEKRLVGGTANTARGSVLDALRGDEGEEGDDEYERWKVCLHIEYNKEMEHFASEE